MLSTVGGANLACFVVVVAFVVSVVVVSTLVGGGWFLVGVVWCGVAWRGAHTLNHTFVCICMSARLYAALCFLGVAKCTTFNFA